MFLPRCCAPSTLPRINCEELWRKSINTGKTLGESLLKIHWGSRGFEFSSMCLLKPRVRGSRCGCRGDHGRGASRMLLLNNSVVWCTGVHTMVAQAVRLRPPVKYRQQRWVGSRRNIFDGEDSSSSGRQFPISPSPCSTE